jgi:hypothetical protein
VDAVLFLVNAASQVEKKDNSPVNGFAMPI